MLYFQADESNGVDDSIVTIIYFYINIVTFL